MVKITRRQNPRGQRKNGKSVFSIINVRNLFVLIVVIAVWKMLTANVGETSSEKPAPPKGVGSILKEYKDPNMNLRKHPTDQRENQKIDAPDGDDGTEKPDEKGVEEATEQPDTKENGEATEQPDVKEDGEATEKPDTNEDGEATEKPEEKPDTNEGDEATEKPEEKPEEKVGKEVHAPNDLNAIVIDRKGTGPTSVGYVKDFVEERSISAFPNLENPSVDLSPKLAKLVNEKSVRPCRDEITGSMNARCLDHDTPLVSYNPELFQRTWCGQEIKQLSAVIMAEHCTDPVAHLFSSKTAPITGDHMPPIVIKSSVEKKLQEKDLEKVECNIPCQHEKGLSLSDINTRNDYFIDGESWKITMDMNSGNNMKDRKQYIEGHFYSTGSLLSSIPLSNFDPRIHSLRNRPAVDFDTANEKAIYLIDSKCSASSTKRNRWFDAVSEKLTVDSYGSCGHNIEVPQGMTIDTAEGRIALTKQYRIVLAFDDSTTKDHISDLVFEAFVSGAVPVIVGADNLRERMPPNSFINVNDFTKWRELGDYVKKVISDKKLWMTYHKWRDDEGAVAAFEKQFEFTRVDSTCRLCRWAYAKKYGLGWDHTAQEVRSISKVPTDKFCTTADHGLVSKPFSEQWATKKSGEEEEKLLEEDAVEESCSALSTDGRVTVDSFSAHRKVIQHDGVTDFLISEAVDERKDSQTTLRFKFPGVRNPEGACFYNTHLLVDKASKVSSASIQDDLVKITVLADWDTKITSVGEGIMEVEINKHGESNSEKDGSRTRRVRVIVEEMNEIFDKMTEFHPSSFCEMMTRDFINPIGVYFVDS